MYNFRLKSYGNGTAQLTYYHNPVFLKDDYKTRPATYFDYMSDSEISDMRAYDDGFYYNENMELMCETPFEDIPVSSLPDYLQPGYKESSKLNSDELAAKKQHSLITSMNRTKKAIYDYGRGNIWEWFITLTFKPVEQFNAENFDECKKKVSKWFHNIRLKYCLDIKYLAVPEQHESGAWHFHCLVSNCDGLDFEVAKNMQMYLRDKNTGEYVLDKYGVPVRNKYYLDNLRTSYPDGEYIYNIKQYKNGFSSATRISDTKKAVSYVVKYITKELSECGFGKRRYLVSNNLNLPVVTVGLMGNEGLMQLVTDIEYRFGLKLSIDCIKTYKVETENYENAVTILEFDSPDNVSVDNERKVIKLNEIMRSWYE